MLFLMKLNDDYVQARTNILMMQPLPNLSTTYRLLVQEERHQEVSGLVTQHHAMAFAAYDKRKHYERYDRNKP